MVVQGPSPSLHPSQRLGLKLIRQLSAGSQHRFLVPWDQVASLEGTWGRGNLRDRVSNSDGN